MNITQEAKDRVIIDAGEYIRTIEAQEAEIKRLREALEQIAKGGELIGKTQVALLYDDKAVKIAQAALKKGE